MPPQPYAADAKVAGFLFMLQAGLLPDVSVGMGDGAPGCFHPSHGVSTGISRGCLFLIFPVGSGLCA